MNLSKTIETIEYLCGDATFSFVEKCAAVADAIAEIDTTLLLERLDEGGLIPERFDRDSTEEKLYAKYWRHSADSRAWRAWAEGAADRGACGCR